MEQQEVLKGQSAALMKLAEAVKSGAESRADGRHSAIKISPNVKWPVMDDSTDDPEDFKLKFLEVCQLAND